MAINGPIIPKRYYSAAVATTPLTTTFAAYGEIITCPRTGRMWMLGTDGTQNAVRPVRPEWSAEYVGTPNYAGVDGFTSGFAPFQSAALRLYSSSSIQMSTDRDGTARQAFTAARADLTGLAVAATDNISIATTQAWNANGNVTIRGGKVGLDNIGSNASTTRYFLTCNQDSGIEFGFNNADGSGPLYTSIGYMRRDKCQMDQIVEANAGIKIPSITSSSILATDASGNIIAGTPASVGAPTSASYVTLSNDATLTAERVLAVGNHLTLTDAGANGNATINWKYDPNKRAIVDSECNAAGNLTVSQTGTGAGVTYGSTGGTHYQTLATLSTGSTATGRASLGSATITSVVFGSGLVRYTTYVRLTQLSTTAGSQSHVLRAGFYDQLDAVAVSDGVYFEYTDNVNSGKFTCNVMAGGTGLGPQDSGTTVAANTWYRLDIEVTASPSTATFYINGTSVYNTTSSVPTGTAQTTGFAVTLRKVLGTSAHTVQADYIGCVWEVAR